MKKLILFLPLIIFSFLSYAQVIKEKNATARPVESFHSIEVSGGFDVYISQSYSYALAVSAATIELRDEIVTKVENGKLIIYFNTQNKLLQKFNNKELKVFLSAPDIRLIKASGATDVNIAGSFKAEDIEINLSGASDLKGEVDINRLSINLSGASDVNLSGNVKKLEVNSSGASDFKGKNLNALKCSVEASGASNVTINVSEILEPKASGASHIKYFGNPRVQGLSATGASKITVAQ